MAVNLSEISPKLKAANRFARLARNGLHSIKSFQTQSILVRLQFSRVPTLSYATLGESKPRESRRERDYTVP